MPANLDAVTMQLACLLIPSTVVCKAISAADVKVYRGRRPDKSAYHRIVSIHLEHFIEQSKDPNEPEPGLPAFVEAEFRAFHSCGLSDPLWHQQGCHLSDGMHKIMTGQIAARPLHRHPFNLSEQTNASPPRATGGLVRQRNTGQAIQHRGWHHLLEQVPWGWCPVLKRSLLAGCVLLVSEITCLPSSGYAEPSGAVSPHLDVSLGTGWNLVRLPSQANAPTVPVPIDHRGRCYWS